MTTKYICDGCGKESFLESDIPTYKMLVCDNYDGDSVQLCDKCEKRVSDIWCHRKEEFDEAFPK